MNANINKVFLLLICFALSGCYSITSNIREGGTFIPHIFADRPDPNDPRQKIDSDSFYFYVGTYQNAEIYRVNPRYVRNLKFNGHLLVKDEKVVRVFQEGEYEEELRKISDENDKKARKILAEHEGKAQKIISEKNLKELYKNGSFYILQDGKQKLIYINNGEIRSPDEVESEIRDYNAMLKSQEDRKKYQEKIASINKLESEFEKLGGNLPRERLKFCTGGPSYFDACKEKPEWEANLKKAIAQAKAAQVAREQCLNNGTIGICQSSSQNNTIYMCGQNIITAMENMFNQYCYTTDKINIHSKMEVRNNSGKAVSDITFECTQIAKSGTSLAKNKHTIYDTWQHKEVKLVQIKSFKHEQVAEVNCKAISWR